MGQLRDCVRTIRKRCKITHSNTFNLRRIRCNGHFDGFAFEEENHRKDITKVIEKFEAFCVGKTNETFERYSFNICDQKECDSIDGYVSKLRKLAKTYNYGQLEESLIRDRIVWVNERRIKAVDTPTDWVSSLVTVKKPNGKLRICIDPKPLNKALKRSHYPLPIIDDLLPELNKAKIFSKCDVKTDFGMNMDESSSYLTTFETPFGRFRWMKMPFGISPAPEYFQQFLEREIENLPGVRTVADDILIYGEGDTVEEATADHDIKLKAFLDRCRSRNIKLNRDKFQLRLTEMPYIGHLLTADGVKPGPEKIAAITQMDKPKDVKEFNVYWEW
ncbi:unnamed protein product [Mytilus coruscus]|uniref:Reverse transcriptase domain-containing protein n=1 Tax=Mytilus coruscus TaxID=42192 RepID=A0A6J8BUY6_MYTCO|nr:unnamed protein product [Mytilus coruscus]